MADFPISHVQWATGGNPGLLNFLDRQLRPDAGYSLKDEYPSLFLRAPGGESFYIDGDDGPAAHVAFLVREFKHPDYQMRIGLIGSVVTAPKYRGRGLGTLLVTKAMEELRRRGSVIALLWSDKTDFYGPLGFHRAGREFDFRFPTSLEAKGTEPVAFNAERHAKGLWECYRSHSAGIDRSREELEKLCSIPKSRIFVTERGSSVTSYIAIQKGADFENYIHEWGGDMGELLRNIAWVQTREFPKAELTLICPAYYDAASFRNLARLHWDGVLGLIKILDLPALIEIYKTYLKKQRLDLPWSEPPRDELAGLRAIFGDASPLTHPVLPFFLWGFDSV